MNKVSVIVPFYNTNKYLEKCLNSLINQTLKELEIIMVNDGSTDNSLDIVKSFQEKDSRIKIVEQEHLKQGAARNAGMKVASGEYIGFVDSDDWVDLDYYEKLYNAAQKYDADIALATNVRIGNGKTKKRLNIKEERFVTILQEKCDIQNQPNNPCPTNKIYRKEMLEKNSIQWPEGVFFEDKLFTIQAIYYANGIVTVPDIYYYYYRNPNSTVNSADNKSSLKFEEDKKCARIAVLEFLREKDPQIRDKDFWAVTEEKRILSIPIYTRKESIHTVKHLLFAFIPFKEEAI